MDHTGYILTGFFCLVWEKIVYKIEFRTVLGKKGLKLFGGYSMFFALPLFEKQGTLFCHVKNPHE